MNHADGICGLAYSNDDDDVVLFSLRFMLLYGLLFLNIKFDSYLNLIF